jgi:hypothetical protein
MNANFVWAQNTYYIDSINGDNNNSRLSESSSWKSHTMVESAPLQRGDTVLFFQRISLDRGHPARLVRF